MNQGDVILTPVPQASPERHKRLLTQLSDYLIK